MNVQSASLQHVNLTSHHRFTTLAEIEKTLSTALWKLYKEEMKLNVRINSGLKDIQLNSLLRAPLSTKLVIKTKPQKQRIKYIITLKNRGLKCTSLYCKITLGVILLWVTARSRKFLKRRGRNSIAREKGRNKDKTSRNPILRRHCETSEFTRQITVGD